MFIVDAMSSFGGVDIPMAEYGIDFLISSANKCIQGVPGFSFILARRSLLEQSAGKARSLSLDLYDQWQTMEKDGKWRFTSPTHVVLGLCQGDGGAGAGGRHPCPRGALRGKPAPARRTAGRAGIPALP